MEVCMWGGEWKGDNGNTKEKYPTRLGVSAGLGEMGEGRGYGGVSRKQRYLS